MAATVPPWTCPSCHTTLVTPFCPGCGERPVGPPDLTLKGIAAQVLKAVGGVDGRLLRSLRLLLGRPGALTEAHARGQRKPYLGPFQLLLIANVFFFAAQSLTHTKICTTRTGAPSRKAWWRAVWRRRRRRSIAMRRCSTRRWC